MHAANIPLDLAALRFPLVASEKLDGFRLLVIGNKLLTKTLGEMPNRNLRSHLADLLALSREGWVFDCECYSPELELNELQSVLQSHAAEIPAHVSAYVFDALTLTEWFNRRTIRFERRRDRYERLLAERKPAHVQAVAYQSIDTADALLGLYRSVLADHGEGLMLRTPAGGYKFGRCTRRDKLVWKLKPETLPA